MTSCHRSRDGRFIRNRLETTRPTALNRLDRKSTRLNSSHLVISYAVFCLKKKIISNAIHKASQELIKVTFPFGTCVVYDKELDSIGLVSTSAAGKIRAIRAKRDCTTAHREGTLQYGNSTVYDQFSYLDGRVVKYGDEK